MKSFFLLFYLTLFPLLLMSQIVLVKEGITINNYEQEIWYGDIIVRNFQTMLIYRNNSISSRNAMGYMLEAGDERVYNTNNKLDGEIISGNKFTWNGTDMTSITHGIFTGYNINAVIKYNYLEKVPMGIIRKSNGMTNTSGGVSYNIIRSPNVGIVAKGMNNVNIYNNTFYSERSNSETYRGLIEIYTNTDISPNAPSTGAKIFNNIFYTKHQIININIAYEADLTNFMSDYNLFYCEEGTPIFNYLGTKKTFEQWQKLGYDTHSVFVNPNFVNFITLVPSKRLDYGINLGSDWQTGLSTTAQWIVGKSPSTVNQNGSWQVGARIYQKPTIVEISIIGEGGVNTITSSNGSLQLYSKIVPENAGDDSVTWSITNGGELGTITPTGLLTAISNGIVTVEATATDGSGVKGELQITITNQKILIENISIIDDLTNDTIKGIGTKLVLKVAINPSNATNQSIIWSVENLTGKAIIDANGLLTTISQGTINVIAKASDESQSTIQKKYTIVNPVSVKNLTNLTHFKLFPNPTQDKIQLQIDQMTSAGVTVIIINTQGQILVKERVFDVHTEWSIAQFSGNIFFVTVIDETSFATKKIIVGSKAK